MKEKKEEKGGGGEREGKKTTLARYPRIMPAEIHQNP